MLCSNCGTKDANFHYKYMNNGRVTELHLCSDCARELGYVKDNDSIFNIGNFLGDFISAPKVAQTHSVAAKCPDCGTTYDFLRRSGFVGCDKCYEVFAKPVEMMLSKLQPSTIHKGKLSGTEGKKIERENTLKELKDALKRAVIDEKYEEAAVLRDKIKAYEEKGEDNNG